MASAAAGPSERRQSYVDVRKQVKQVKKPTAKDKINRILLSLSPFRVEGNTQEAVNDLKSFKHRKQLINQRHSYANRASVFIVISVVLTFVLADLQLQDGLVLRDIVSEADKHHREEDLEQFSAPGVNSDDEASASTSAPTTSADPTGSAPYDVRWNICVEHSREPNQDLGADIVKAAEICFYQVYQPTIMMNIISGILTILSLVLAIFCFNYFRVEHAIYKFDNSLCPDLPYAPISQIRRYLLEMVCILVHPITYLPGQKWSFYSCPLTYFCVLLRMAYLIRFALLNSSLFSNVATESVATFNQINFGATNRQVYSLVLRHFMSNCPGSIMIGLVIIVWVTMAWALRLAEGRFALLTCGLDYVSFGYLEMAWLVPITMTTIGYGDFYAKSGYGKFFSLLVGFFGLVASAVLVGMCTDILAMTRREKNIHSLLETDQSKRELRNRAAIVIQRIYRRHLNGYNVMTKKDHKTGDDLGHYSEKKLHFQAKTYVPLIKTVHVWKAISEFRETRIRVKYQSDDFTDLDTLRCGQDETRVRVDNVAKEINCRMDKIEKKLDLLLSKMTEDIDEALFKM